MKPTKYLASHLFSAIFLFLAFSILSSHLSTKVYADISVEVYPLRVETLPSPGDTLGVRVRVYNDYNVRLTVTVYVSVSPGNYIIDPDTQTYSVAINAGGYDERTLTFSITSDVCQTGTVNFTGTARAVVGANEWSDSSSTTLSDGIGGRVFITAYEPNGTTPANGSTITVCNEGGTSCSSQIVGPSGMATFSRRNCNYRQTISASRGTCSATKTIPNCGIGVGRFDCICNGQDTTASVTLSCITPTPTATPTGTPPPTPTGCPGMTCRYSEPVPTGTCASGYRWVTGTGCTGDNCVGCTYVDGCSTTTCIPVVTPTSTPPPIWGCYQFKCHVTIDGDRQLCYDSTGAYRYTSQCTPRWCVDNDTGPIWCWPEANVDCTPNAADCTPPTPTPTPTPIPCTDPRKAINAYVTPTPGLAGQPISFTFTSNWGYTGTRLDTDGGTTGGCPFSMPTPPDGKTYAWRWACTAISNPRPSPPYTASFTNTQNCPKTISYTVVPNTGTITGRLFEDINNNQCLNLPPDLLASFTNQLTFNLSFRTVTNIYPCSVIWATREFTCANIPGGVSGGLNVVPAGMDPYTGWYCAGDNNCQNQNCTSFSVTGGGTATRHLGFVRGPWWQTKLGDVRAGGVEGASGDLTDRIPLSCTTPNCTPNISLTSNTKGIVSRKGFLETGSGFVSDTPRWKVQNGFQVGTAYSYDYVMERLRQTGTPTQAFNFNTPQVVSGVYTAGQGTIPQGPRWNIPGTSKIVVLVNGNLTIEREIRVAQGGFLAIFVKGDILIDPSIKEPAASVNTDLEGIFVADGSFKTGIVADAAGRLNIAGTVVVDADLNGSGGLLLQRNLGVRNSSYPSFYVSYRPDFLLSAPALLQTKTFSWQEVSP